MVLEIGLVLLGAFGGAFAQDERIRKRAAADRAKRVQGAARLIYAEMDIALRLAGDEPITELGGMMRFTYLPVDAWTRYGDVLASELPDAELAAVLDACSTCAIAQAFARNLVGHPDGPIEAENDARLDVGLRVKCSRARDVLEPYAFPTGAHTGAHPATTP